jgi:VanZ family protein
MDIAPDARAGVAPKLKILVFAGLAAAIAYLSLAPAEDTPTGGLFWDKAQHAAAYLVLTGAGLVFFPRRSRIVFFGVLAFGVGIEVLQSAMGFGRDGDWRDAVANTAGALVALRLVQLWRKLRR